MQGKTYISGPISGWPDHNRSAFIDAEAQLRAAGHEVFNPIDNGLPSDSDWSTHMRADIKALMECETIYMLRGWHASKGASLELHIAKQLGMAVFFQGIEGQYKPEGDA